MASIEISETNFAVAVKLIKETEVLVSGLKPSAANHDLRPPKDFDRVNELLSGALDRLTRYQS